MKLFMMIPLYHIQIKLMSNYFMHASSRAKLTAYSEYLDDYNVFVKFLSNLAKWYCNVGYAHL